MAVHSDASPKTSARGQKLPCPGLLARDMDLLWAADPT